MAGFPTRDVPLTDVSVAKSVVSLSSLSSVLNSVP